MNRLPVLNRAVIRRMAATGTAAALFVVSGWVVASGQAVQPQAPQPEQTKPGQAQTGQAQQAGKGQPAAAKPGEAAQGSRLTAGPTYTSSDGAGAPKFPSVEVVYAVTAGDGSPIVAKPSELKLTSDGKDLGTASAIRNFDQTGYGITAILAIDASGSMRGAPIQAIHSSIAKFVNQARPIDKVEVVTFADETQYDVPFGGTPDAIKKELATVKPRGSFTHLYDGLLDALAQFKADQPKRRQIVVISDGHDEHSAHSLSQVLAEAKKQRVVIDCIGLTKDHGEYLHYLRQLSAETGGTFRRAMNAQDLDTFIGQGIDATRVTPVATFVTTNLTADNTGHPAELRWLPGNLTATTIIQTPEGSSLDKVKTQVMSNLWMWVLGGCFAAGLLLLVISWVGARSKRKPMPAVPQTSSQPQVAGMAASAGAPAYAANPPFTPMPDPLGSSAAAQQRTPTLPESSPRSGRATEADRTWISPTPSKAAVTTIEPPVPLSPGQVSGKLDGKEDLNRGRSRTKLASFFDAPDAGPYALIYAQAGELSGKAIPVTKARFTLGALAANDLSIPGDPTISGQHARLFWEGSILKIEDLQSTNGTFVNAERLAPGRQLLRPGDEVRLGQTVLILDRV